MPKLISIQRVFKHSVDNMSTFYKDPLGLLAHFFILVDIQKHANDSN